jgi:pimeloyl-ACP methyl ester carboxylesterase
MRAARKILFVVAALTLGAGIGFLLRPVSYFDGMMYLHEMLTGVHSRTTSVEGIRIHYLVEGPESGAAVVLVHGLGGSAEDWRTLAPYLARAGYRVYIPDLPGYGRSEQPAGFSYSVRDEAAVVIGFMDALGLKQVDLGGWSMGGWIVQLVAGQAPQRIRRLMIFDSAGLYVQPDWDTRLFTPTSADQLNQLDALLMPHPPAVPGFVARDILRVSNERAWVIQRAVASMLTGRDATDPLLPRLKMPVLLVWGDQDRIMPLAQGQTMHKLVPQSELDVFTGCGHLAPLQCSQEIGPKVVEFIDKE